MMPRARESVRAGVDDMINLVCTPWAWVPLILAVIISVIAVLFANAEPASPDAPRIVNVRFFQGPALTNSGAVSTVLAMLPILLSSDVREDTVSASLLGAATLLFSITTFLSVWLYSTVPAQKQSGDALTLTSNLLIIVQGVVVSCMLVAASCFVVFLLVTPLLGQARGHAPAPKVVILKCTHSGCSVESAHGG